MLTPAELEQLWQFALQLRHPPATSETLIAIREVPRDVVKTVVQPVTVPVEKRVLVEVTKPVEVVKPVVVLKDRPIEVVVEKIIERIKEVPREVPRDVVREVVRVVPVPGVPFNPLLKDEDREKLRLKAEVERLEARVRALPPPRPMTRRVVRDGTGLVAEISDPDGTVTSVLRDREGTATGTVRRSPTGPTVRTAFVREDGGRIVRLKQSVEP